jgi:hypothetical protein
LPRWLILICTCTLWSVASTAQTNWFVFDLGETKVQVCDFLQSHSDYKVVSPKKCPGLDDNPAIDVTETITAETFKVDSKQDVAGMIGAGSKKVKDAISPAPAAPQKTHTVRLVFKNDRLIAIWMTFPSDYYWGLYERAQKEFRAAKFKQDFPLAPVWQSQAPHENGETPTNWIAVFVKGITRVYLVRYNEVQGGMMTGWMGLESRTEDEPKVD